MKKRLFICFMCILCCLATALPAPVSASVGSSAPSVHYLKHHTYEELEIYGGFRFTDDKAVYFKNNDMFYNVSDNAYLYNRWARTMNSYLVQNNDGSFTRVERKGYRVHYSSASGSLYYDKETGTFISPDWDNIHYKGTNCIMVETYSKDIQLISSKEIELPLSIFGGFFSGKDYNFVVVGQENPEASDSVEVLRFLKYSKKWELLGQQSVYGANTCIPFDAGSLRMTEDAGLLYIHTAHEMYSGHQANMTFVLDQSTMEIKDQFHGVLNISVGYVSHSFNQFIESDGEYVYRVDHGDAYPRAVVVTRSSVEGSIRSVSYKNAFEIKQGSVGNNDTGVAIGGFALGNNNLIIAGETEDQENSENFRNNKYNIFLSIISKDLAKVSTVMLTNYSTDTSLRVLPPQLVKLSGNRFLVMWEECYTTDNSFALRAVTVDENGNMLCDIASYPMRLSDCQPILCSDGMVRWYVSTGSNTSLYAIHPNNLDEPLIFGDVNSDGYIDCFDAFLILRYDAGFTDKQCNMAVADVNHDGKITTLDASLILQYDAGLISLH